VNDPHTLIVRAPAKINLHLGVGGVQDDGFHPLVTVFQAIGLYDDVAVSRSAGWRLSLAGAAHIDPGTVPVDEQNIVARAGQLLTAHHQRPTPANVTITKSIPVAGGMAGGSADAAAALVALDRLWDLQTSDHDLLELAAELGSDVPFALIGGTALGTGRGHLVDPIDDDGSWWWVAVPSAEGLSTPAVYRHFDKLFPNAGAPAGAEAVLAALATHDPAVLARALHNDLQAAALDLRPDLAALIETGEAAGALRGIVSGSGPTCVFLAAGADDARLLAQDFRDRGHPVALPAPGPVAGTVVVDY
jgi:4-diphosphocytidyl-2-C-methyl-D-erythritol kinase